MAAAVVRDSILRTFIPLLTIGLPTWLWGGRMVQDMTHSISENVMTGLGEGMADGFNQASAKAIDDISKHLISSMSAESFFNNLDGKQIGEKFSEGIQNFLTGTGGEASIIVTGKQIGRAHV